MKTLLHLRDEEQNAQVLSTPDSPYKPRMFIAIDKGRGTIFNGTFLDPYMNIIQFKDHPDKAVSFTDVELSEIQADFVD